MKNECPLPERDRGKRPRHKTPDDKTTRTVEERWTRWGNGSKTNGPPRSRKIFNRYKPPLLVSNPIYRYRSPSVRRRRAFRTYYRILARASYCLCAFVFATRESSRSFFFLSFSLLLSFFFVLVEEPRGRTRGQRAWRARR